MTAIPVSDRPRRNLFVFHLESVAWQTMRAFPNAFPHLTALMAEARTYRMHIAAATSTQMVLAAFLHGNDFEMDAAPGLAIPTSNNPSLLNTLREAGYRTEFLCATPYPERTMLPRFADSLPPVRSTSDFATMLADFEEAVTAGNFAVYAWSQVPHILANLALAAYARSLDELAAGGCAVADNLLGAMLDILRRHGVAEETTIVVYGDHGDDYWTHGFKTGMTHGVEPCTPLVHTPLVIRDPALPAGIDDRIVGTADLAATCLDLLGLTPTSSFAVSGHSLRDSEARAVAFSQNFTANQPDRPDQDVRKCFAAIDHAHILTVSSRGLRLFNHRLDPGNHANILHHFDLEDGLRLRPSDLDAPYQEHFQTAHHLWRRAGLLQDVFVKLHGALEAHVRAKNEYVAAHAEGPLALLDMEAFQRIDRTGRDAFFNRVPPPPPPPPPPPAPPPPPQKKRKLNRRRAKARRRERAQARRPLNRLLRRLGLKPGPGRRRRRRR